MKLQSCSPEACMRAQGHSMSLARPRPWDPPTPARLRKETPGRDSGFKGAMVAGATDFYLGVAGPSD
eukprot:9455969-Alexandrium_andersonii.AAC.1